MSISRSSIDKNTWVYGKATPDQLKEGRKKMYKFICPWCGHEFYQFVGTFERQADGFWSKPRKWTSKVKCPNKKCRNYLKSDSGEIVKI